MLRCARAPNAANVNYALSRSLVHCRAANDIPASAQPKWPAGHGVRPRQLFEPGPAQVCGLLITRTGGKVSDVFQWCRKEDVDLQPLNAG